MARAGRKNKAASACSAQPTAQPTAQPSLGQQPSSAAVVAEESSQNFPKVSHRSCHWLKTRSCGDHRGLQSFSVCVRVKAPVGLKRKRSPTRDSSDSSGPAGSLRGVGPSRNRRFGRQSPQRENTRGRRSAQLEYCGSILEEMLSKKHASSARPFYSLTDAEALRLRDHHDGIRNFMDLSTIKVETASGNMTFG